MWSDVHLSLTAVGMCICLEEETTYSNRIFCLLIFKFVNKKMMQVTSLYSTSLIFVCPFNFQKNHAPMVLEFLNGCHGLPRWLPLPASLPHGFDH